MATGTVGDDKLIGTSGPDVVDGLEGDDLILGFSVPVLPAGEVGASVVEKILSGADFLLGGSGSDAIFGGDGDDQIFGGDGNDWEFENSNRVLITLGSNQYRGGLYGGDGNDIIDGGNGTDVIFGNGGNDTLIGALTGTTTIFLENRGMIIWMGGKVRIGCRVGMEMMF